MTRAIENPEPPEIMGTRSELRMLLTAAEVEDLMVVFCGKELRMGLGWITTAGDSWMATWESWHCLTQGSLQLLACEVGLRGWHGRRGRHWS
ncbi:hypothetical protein ASZ78_011439 [Callipepla squamata]|uniref:Uncharacterized protein n=1 Tax=Callipepla squamata TaxID=9009 RepID=A0A226MC44_CALSU|nr:hypothetical protein ASZ78_011439 [Callipepla squamata]